MATLDPAQYTFIKKVEEGIRRWLLPDTLEPIEIIAITENTSPDEISHLYTSVMQQMQDFSRSVLELRKISAGLRGQMNIAAAQGNEAQYELYRMKSSIDRLLATIDNYVEAYSGHLETLKTIARGLNSECYLYNQRFAAYNF